MLDTKELKSVANIVNTSIIKTVWKHNNRVWFLNQSILNHDLNKLQHPEMCAINIPSVSY